MGKWKIDCSDLWSISAVRDQQPNVLREKGTDTPCLCAETSASTRLLHLPKVRGIILKAGQWKTGISQNITQITAEMLGTAKAGGTQQPVGYKMLLCDTGLYSA